MKFIFAVLFLIAGLALTAYGVMALNDARTSKSWPSVSGEVVSSEVREILMNKPPKDNVKQRKYSPSITYKYEVDGNPYQAKLVSFGETPKNRKPPVEAVVAQYPVGSSQKIYYKPSNPKVAVLQPGMSVQACFLPAVGIILLILGFFAFLGALKRKNRSLN